MNQGNPRHPINEAAVIRASGLASPQMPQTADIGTSVKDIDDRYQLVNEAMASLLCEPVEQLVGMTAQQEAAEMRQSLKRLQQTNQELQKTVTELHYLAGTDKLTGSWNRRRLEETVIHEMERLKRYDHPLSLMIIGIDFFGKATDQHEAAVGDQVLVKLAAVIQSSIRSTDSLTRWGNEEFVVLCPDTTLSTVTILAERLREMVVQAAFSGANNLTFSVGIAQCMRGETWEQWFKRADLALYRAKACGGDQVQFAPETPKHVGGGENASANLVQLSWHATYECGNSVIDEQHRALFGHANKLLAAVLDAQPKDEVAKLIDAVVDAIVEHFNDEEVIITAAGFPREAAHAAIHRELVDNVVKQVSRFHAGTLAIGELFQFLSRNVVARHLLGADREFFPYLATGR